MVDVTFDRFCLVRYNPLITMFILVSMFKLFLRHHSIVESVDYFNESTLNCAN